MPMRLDQHACLTGQCPHESKDDCVREAIVGMLEAQGHQPLGPRPTFVPGYSESGQPRGFMQWNSGSCEWEYWLNNFRAFTFSDFALQLMYDQYYQQKGGNALRDRIEVVIGLHDGHLVLRSVPLSRLMEMLREEGFAVG